MLTIINNMRFDIEASLISTNKMADRGAMVIYPMFLNSEEKTNLTNYYAEIDENYFYGKSTKAIREDLKAYTQKLIAKYK
jgi:dienelactone hydrolase